ncbi:MAG: hypothetical protein LQ342_004829 [Letrouitia transgressa]|nr:MAG: hypothetical protein LQ342_004829 [Letrouitia transgressa]
MLLLAFYFLQVIPEFLDFLFLFGRQEQAVDLYFSAFRQNSRLHTQEQGLTIPEWSWSGFELQLCYGLKSVEPSAGQTASSWSIRHYAIHHTFDIVYVRTSWILIKGNKDMESRIRAATNTCKPNEFSSFDKTDDAFVAALGVHLLLCAWSAENWRWYIKSLEQDLDRLTHGAMTKNADIPVNPRVGNDVIQSLTHRDTQRTQGTQRNRTFSFPRTLSRSGTQASDTITMTAIPQKATFTTPHGKKQPLPPGMKGPALDGPEKPVRLNSLGQQEFFFSDLQDVYDLEEKANETVSILKLNLSVMTQLKEYYVNLFSTSSVHTKLDSLKEKCQYNLDHFRSRIDQTQSDLNFQILRVEALLRKLIERKALLHALLDFENTQVNRQLAFHTKVVNRNMMGMTRDMGKLARKTKIETVSMKIITLVTLVFLPGTFVARRQTLL